VRVQGKREGSELRGQGSGNRGHCVVEKRGSRKQEKIKCEGTEENGGTGYKVK